MLSSQDWSRKAVFFQEMSRIKFLEEDIPEKDTILSFFEEELKKIESRDSI